MQVYRDLRIITARPSPADEARVPHLLYGHVDAAENYSVGRWCVDAQAAIAQARQAGRLPILVGGTGLYFKALTQGLAAVPPIPAEHPRLGARRGSRPMASRRCYAELQQRDPATAAAADAGRPLAHRPRAGSRAGDRPLALRLAPRGHAGGRLDADARA